MKTRYITFLRGINVGGKVLKMEILKEMLGSLGLENIKTYIQSGNVIFDSKESDGSILKKNIENLLENSAGYHIAVFIKTYGEIEEMIWNNPYKSEAQNKNLQLYVTFLEKMPDEEKKRSLETLKDQVISYEFIGREIFSLFKDKTYGKSLFSNNHLEKKLKVQATTRNWTTILKIYELAK